jgi:hypothetical protein
VVKGLEFRVDSLAESVHIIKEYEKYADDVAGHVLEKAGAALEAREKRMEEESSGEGKQRVGMRDVLRGLSRVIDR